MKKEAFSIETNSFYGRELPEEGLIAGYGALIEKYQLPMPIPNRLALISKKYKQYENENWIVLTIRHKPKETLYDQLVFAIKYEGINLLFFKKLFEKLSQKEIIKLVQTEYSGQYSRKMWFLYEWLMGKQLPIPDITIKSYVPLIDEEIQYASPVSINSSRHRIKNNLPGTVDFCPLIYKTEKLENYIKEKLDEKTNILVNRVHKDILLRTSAFLLLKDSKASFTIEKETPTQSRAMRWGRAIAQAGSKVLSKEELLRLQQIVIESKFTKLGFRTEGGFVGEHDRRTGEPIPSHISAKWQDIETLIQGLLNTTRKLEETKFHPVLTAAIVSFGFVFIHPFEDGNGRIHRYLIHHILAKMKFTPQGIIFPVSSAMLDKIEEYRKVLESYSIPLLDFIQWKKNRDNNIEVLNETIDYYRYWDATPFAEFLFDCVNYTIEKIIPEEVDYLQKYDEMKSWLDDNFEMPDKMVALLIRFLEQNNGSFTKRAREKEFSILNDEEIIQIENKFREIMMK